MDPFLQLHTTQEIQVRVLHLHSTLGKMDIWRHIHLHSTYRKRDKISLLHLHSLFWKSVKSTRYIYILHIENWTFPPLSPYVHIYRYPVPYLWVCLSICGQVKSRSGATRPRGDHPDPDLSLLPSSLRGLWRGLVEVGRSSYTTYTANQPHNWPLSSYGEPPLHSTPAPSTKLTLTLTTQQPPAARLQWAALLLLLHPTHNAT